MARPAQRVQPLKHQKGAQAQAHLLMYWSAKAHQHIPALLHRCTCLHRVACIAPAQHASRLPNIYRPARFAPAHTYIRRHASHLLISVGTHRPERGHGRIHMCGPVPQVAQVVQGQAQLQHIALIIREHRVCAPALCEVHMRPQQCSLGCV